MKYRNIEAERVRLGLSKKDLAAKLSIAEKTYYNWQSGVNPIPSNSLECMSRLFNASIDYLLGLQNPRAG